MGGAFRFTQTVNQGPCQVAHMLHLGVPRFFLVVILPSKESFHHFKGVASSLSMLSAPPL